MLRVVREFLSRGDRAQTSSPIEPLLDQLRGELGRELQLWFSLPAPWAAPGADNAKQQTMFPEQKRARPRYVRRNVGAQRGDIRRDPPHAK